VKATGGSDSLFYGEGGWGWVSV